MRALAGWKGDNLIAFGNGPRSNRAGNVGPEDRFRAKGGVSTNDGVAEVCSGSAADLDPASAASSESTASD